MIASVQGHTLRGCVCLCVCVGGGGAGAHIRGCVCLCVCVWGGGGGDTPIFSKIGPKCRSQNAFEETKETLLFQYQLD